MANTKKSDQQTSASKSDEKAGDVPHAGNPGDGAGRTYDPGTQHSGVFPVSGPPPDDPNATFQGMASFGQGDRGAAGYQDSGRSEVFTMPPEGSAAPTGGPQGTSQARVGSTGSNAGEVDPGISGRGETTGQKPRDTGGAGFGNAVGGGGTGDVPPTGDATSGAATS